MTAQPEDGAPRRVWLGTSLIGGALVALAIGLVAGCGAVAFRWLVFGFTWAATGHRTFGQQGRVGSAHLSFLGPWFFLVIPIAGGVLYGPLIYRFAREARGHGVPEVMLAVTEEGGRIRPQVSLIKALSSALCIATGGSVGREGPIVQIGASLASSLGQFVGAPSRRLRILVACGAAGGIAATFNAPLTGVLFGLEIILREFSVDAAALIVVSATTSTLVGRVFFGSAPFLSGIPHHLSMSSDWQYVLVLALGALAGFVGVGFKDALYRVEDACDALWGSRPEWLRPTVGGIALGLVLLVAPETYGVGYPVMNEVLGGDKVLWIVAGLALAKIVATSLTMGIGGSGGIFAPSLFIGAMSGEAFGLVARHVFGASAGAAAFYGVIAMGAVFAGGTQAPIVAVASVLEMTGQFGLALPVMAAIAVATIVSRRLTYGTIYTTKLLRRGIDIDALSGESATQSE
ncbi:MAG TPA: chloride channel protein [Acidimicrobiales bacterium]